MAEKEGASTHAPWQKEFFKNIEQFVKYGLPEEKAKELLVKFLTLSGSTPMPKVMESFRDESALERVGVYTQKDPAIRDFMVDGGISPDRLEFEGFGEFSPLVPNDSPENMEKNRRVEFHILEFE